MPLSSQLTLNSDKTKVIMLDKKIITGRTSDCISFNYKKFDEAQIVEFFGVLVDSIFSYHFQRKGSKQIAPTLRVDK